MKIRKRFNIRLTLQIFFFALITAISVNKTLAEGGGGVTFLSTASLHAICPFGGVVTLYNLATVGTYIQKIHASALVLLVLVAILSVLFGPVFCGWVCPLGSLQEWIGKLGARIWKRNYNRVIPEKLDKTLRYTRYLVLIWVVFVTARSGALLFANIDPYQALFTFWTSEVAPAGLVILLVTLVSSLFVARPWCKYACPYGALLGLSNKIRIFKIRCSSSTCINCRKCDRICPMNLDVSTPDKITQTQCVSCLECTSGQACPVPETLNLQVLPFKPAMVNSKEEQPT